MRRRIWPSGRGGAVVPADNQGRGGQGEPVWDARSRDVCAGPLWMGRWRRMLRDRGRRGRVALAGELQIAGGSADVAERDGGERHVPYYSRDRRWRRGWRDQRWEKFGEEYFGWTAKHDTHFKNKRTMAKYRGGDWQRTNLFYQAPNDNDHAAQHGTVCIPRCWRGGSSSILCMRNRLELEASDEICGA